MKWFNKGNKRQLTTFSISDQAKVVAEVEHTTSGVVGVHKEFRERAGFNRRRGAMRRRVHQVNNFK